MWGPPLHQPFWKTSEPQIWGKTPTGHRWPWKRSTQKRLDPPPKKKRWTPLEVSANYQDISGKNMAIALKIMKIHLFFSPGCSKVAPHFFSCCSLFQRKKHTENFEAFYISPTYATCWGYTFWTLPTPGSWFWNLIRCSTHAWLIHVGSFLFSGSTSPGKRKRSAKHGRDMKVYSQ